MKKILYRIKYFLLTHDDIEMVMVTSVLGTIFAFYVYCVWSLIK